MEFNNIISLGQDCGVASAIRNLEYKDASYPFDWSVSLLPFITQCFQSKFSNLSNLFPKTSKGTLGKTIIENNIYFYHDLLFNDLINNPKNIDNFNQKYKKRSERLHNLLESNNKILFIRKAANDSLNDIIKLKNIIKNNYPNLQFKILLLNNLNETNNDPEIIYFHKHIDCFLKLKNDIWKHRDGKKTIQCIIDAVSNIKCQKYPQPKYRDSLFE